MYGPFSEAHLLHFLEVFKTLLVLFILPGVEMFSIGNFFWSFFICTCLFSGTDGSLPPGCRFYTLEFMARLQVITELVPRRGSLN